MTTSAEQDGFVFVVIQRRSLEVTRDKREKTTNNEPVENDVLFIIYHLGFQLNCAVSALISERIALRSAIIAAIGNRKLISSDRAAGLFGKTSTVIFGVWL